MSLMQPVEGIYHKLTLLICLVIIFLSFLMHKKIIIQNVQASLFFSLYIFFCVISAGVNQDIELLKNSLQLFCIFFTVAIFFNDIVKRHVKEIVLNGVLLAYIPFLILCFQKNHFMYGAFAGVFENPNTLGVSMIGLTVVVLMKLYEIIIAMLEGYQQLKLTIQLGCYTIFYLFALYVIMLSNARTSLLTVAILTTVMIVLLVKRTKKRFLPLLKFSLLLIVACLLLIIAIHEVEMMQKAFQSILLKMEKKSTNITDGRLDIWKYVFEHFSFWGHGTESLWVIGVSHAHNTFVNILQEAGLLPLVCYAIFLISIARGHSQMDKQLVVFTVFVIVAALGVSTFEILYFNVLHILVFVVSGFGRNKNMT
ncbi:O-antigen ligase family protein [Lysinibacillus sp. NPDC093190]|uniref:O-antigen ligase family protein n=1 Tax=Lysinibacillus sp. NPDC093190 TaxID=3390575 RepID=UPI003D023231